MEGGCGRRSSVDVMSGRRASIASGSGAVERGEKREDERDVKVRVWWVRCVVRAECAVMSLFNVVSDMIHSMKSFQNEVAIGNKESCRLTV